MKKHLMNIFDKLLVRKRVIIESIIDQLKNISQIEHSRHRSPNMHFHDLRHSAAKILISMGINPKVIQELLGHSDISITLGIYGHLFPSMQKDIVDKWQGVFGGIDEDEEDDEDEESDEDDRESL